MLLHDVGGLGEKEADEQLVIGVGVGVPEQGKHAGCEEDGSDRGRPRRSPETPVWAEEVPELGHLFPDGPVRLLSGHVRYPGEEFVDGHGGVDTLRGEVLQPILHQAREGADAEEHLHGPPLLFQERQSPLG